MQLRAALLVVVSVALGGCPGHAASGEDERAGTPASTGEEVAADQDADGIADGQDRCPDAGEDLDGFEDEDGCPDVDSDPQTILVVCTDEDGDGIDDDDDRCPDAAETYDAHDDDDGCPDASTGASVVTREGSALVLAPALRFDIERERLRPESLAGLDALASFLAHHREIVVLEVQGHTDDRGIERARPLGERRAEAVREALVARGVEAARIVARGYGATRPLVAGGGAEARQANRRIELLVLDEDGPCSHASP